MLVVFEATEVFNDVIELVLAVILESNAVILDVFEAILDSKPPIVLELTPPTVFIVATPVTFEEPSKGLLVYVTSPLVDIVLPVVN